MVRLTLADWTCTINHGVYPLDKKGLLREFTGQYRKIPVAWIIARKVMMTLEPKMSLRATDSSHISHGEVSLYHVLNIAKANGELVPDRRTIKTLVLHGITCLRDIGSWLMTNGTAVSLKSKALVPSGAN